MMNEQMFLDCVHAHSRLGYGRMMQLTEGSWPSDYLSSGEVMFTRRLVDATAANIPAERLKQIISRAWYRQDKIGALHESGPCYGQLTTESQAMLAADIDADPLFTR